MSMCNRVRTFRLNIIALSSRSKCLTAWNVNLLTAENEGIKLSRNVGMRLPIGTTSYSRRMHYVVSKRRDAIAHWHVIFERNALCCFETSGSDCPATQHHIPEECITLPRNVRIRMPIGTTSYCRRMHYVVSKRRDQITH